MINKEIKIMAAVVIVAVLFPALVTSVISGINGNKDGSAQNSGKTIEIDNGEYSASMDMEDYIPCVLMAQMPITSPKELLKAQSVVIRTYILKQMGQNTKISSKRLGLPYVSYVKLQDMWVKEYIIKHPSSIEGIIGNLTGMGGSKIFQDNMDYLKKLIKKTGLRVMKNDGELILPLYHGISNGKTREGTEILGDGYSYLKSVDCDTDMQEKDFLGVKYLTLKQLKDKLVENDIIIYKDKKELFDSKDMDIQKFISMFDHSDRDSSGYNLSIKIGDTRVPAESFSKAIGLNSTSIEISEYEKGIRFTSKGEGHGLGMSLAYAANLAKHGYDWQKILKTFYDTVIIEY